MILAGIIIGCLLCGAVCYAIMQNKGYEQPTGWFFAGLFLGIIGIILVLIQPNETTSTSYSQSSTSSRPSYSSSGYGSRSTVVCTACGETNSSSSTHCQKCGSRLNKPSLPILSKEGSWKCKCGAMNYSYETSCHRCGEKKSNKPAIVKENAPTSPAQVKAMAQKDKTIAEQLEELKKLKEQDLITEADFEAKKKQILGI